MIACIPDNIHINNKNFTSLINYCNANDIKLDYNNKNNDLFSAYGIYDKNDERIKKYVCEFLDISKDNIFLYKTENINLFQVCRAELLSYVITKYSQDKYIWNEEELQDIIFNNYHDELCCCLAASKFWIEFWLLKLTQNKYDFAFIFSGSLIYSRTLLEILKTKLNIKVFVCETYLTGHEFYFEEKYNYIANNSLIKSSSFYNSIPYSTDATQKLLALNKYLMKNNLNVKQPLTSDKSNILVDNVVLIIGQVVNDFSILEHNNVGFYTIGVYKELITQIITNTNYNVIFKAHPWERKKNNLKNNFTYSKLSNEFKTTKRVQFVEDFNIYDLFDISKHVIVLNSQGGIEAVENGIKPITLAQPFYYNKGFTIDFDISRINQTIDYLNTHDNSYLSYDEFKQFEIFLSKVHLNHLFTKFPSGEKKLREILKKPTEVKLYSRKSSLLPENFYTVFNNSNTQKCKIESNTDHNTVVNRIKKIANKFFKKEEV